MTSSPPEPKTTRPALDPDNLPWLLRSPARDRDVKPADREHDRRSALEARRTALVGLPLVAVAWLAVALAAGPQAVRIATITALVISVALGVRTAMTIQRFRRRWVDPKDLTVPPRWLTLLTVAATVAAVVALANLAADLRAERPAVVATIFTMVALGVVGAGIVGHVAGGRSVTAALREPTQQDDSGT